jgi:serine protease AprX
MAVSLRVRGLVVGAAIVAATGGVGRLALLGVDVGRPAARGVTAAGVQRVVAMGAPGREAEAERTAVDLGGRITRRLAVINGFAAEIPATAVPRLASSPAVVSVRPDRTVRAVPGARAASGTPGTATTGPGGVGSVSRRMAAGSATGRTASTAGGTTAAVDTGRLSAVAELTGARASWASGVTGDGVDVALIDTGVAPVPGLDTPGKVLVGPDVSFDAPGAPAPGLDAHGHGTFMAGIIAGRDAGATVVDPSAFMGVAPDARIVNVKVGAADGAADVSQVIAAIDWVTQHAHDPGVNIRVLNLSFGTDGSQSYLLDPLAQAAEQAWRHGIVVVAAAGNDGRPTKELADPARDPYLLAVGGDDPNGTLDPADDSVPDFAQHGTNARPVDVIAPATHLLSLRVPGSYVDTLATNTGQVGERLQRGSGTSEAAAVVSGLAALLLQKYPDARPDEIKALLAATATPVLPGGGRPAAPGQMLHSGHGLVDVAAALAAGPGREVQQWPAGTGAGTLDGARGGVFVAADGVPLTGDQDIFGHSFDSPAMAAGQAAAAAWSGGIWNGSRWTGDGWSGGRWTTGEWTGTDWTGGRWTGGRWTTMAWTGGRWTGGRWTGTVWTGGRWTGGRWTSTRWATAGWD